MAFLQSSPPREPFLHAPASVLWLIAILVVAHVVRILLPIDLSMSILDTFSFTPYAYAHGAPIVSLVVPFVSHIFLHADFVHLGANCLWLLVFGPVVARRLGTLLFYVFFLLTGILGAATYLAVNWGSVGGVIGASGAIAGLMGAAIRMFPWPGQPSAGALAPLLSRQVLMFTAFWFVTNLLLALTGFGAPGEMHEIAWQVHLGGYMAGLLLIDVFDNIRRRHVTKVISVR